MPFGDSAGLYPELFEVSPPGKLDCSSVSEQSCLFLTQDEERKVRRAGRPEGALIDRTQGDPDKNLSIQLTDYDVSEWRPLKERHRLGLGRVMQFIIDRGTQILQSREGIEITISGAASRTGSKAYNDLLSCKRAACAAHFIRQHLPVSAGGSPALLAKIRFTVGGEGFEKATCVGTQCEIGEFRSVLISVHRPGLPPPPVPVIPPGWPKYRIRCCSFKTESLGEAIVGDLIERGLDALPEPLKKAIEGSDQARSLIDKVVKQLIAQLKKLLARLPGALGKLAKSLSQRLPFPVEFIRDTAVFQIVERDKPNPKDIILCYTGFGLRLLFPRNLPGVIPGPLKNALRDFLKKELRIEGVGIDVLFDILSGKIPPIESKTPGPFTEFDVDRNVTLDKFEGDAVVFKGPDLPGKVRLGFDSKRSFRHPDPVKRPKLRCAGCTASIVPVTVGTGRGIDIIAPTTGKLDDGSCRCEPAPARVVAGVRQRSRAAVRPRIALRPSRVVRRRSV